MTNRNSNKGSGGIQSIHRAINLLKVIAEGEGQGMRLIDICSVLDLKTTTAYRILSSLVEEGMLAHNNLTKKYSLGFELLRIGRNAKKLRFIEICRPVMENICRESQDTVYLFEKTGTWCQCLIRLEGSYPVRASATNEGDFKPLGVGAASLAILVKSPEKQLGRILKTNTSAYDEYGLTVDQIGGLVKLSNKLGYAWADRQVSSEMSAVGVAIHNGHNEVVGAISVATITSRMKTVRRKHIVEMMKTEIENINFT